MEAFQTPQLPITAEALYVRKLFGRTVDLNVCGAAAMPSRDRIIGFVALISVVLDSDRGPPGSLDHEREHRPLNGEVVMALVEPDLKRCAQPEPRELAGRKAGRDWNQRDVRGGRTVGIHQQTR